MALTESDISRLEQEYRDKSRVFDHATENLKAARFYRRMYYLTVFGAMALFGLLGYTVVVGLWTEKPTFTRWAGLVIVLVLWAAAGKLLLDNRKKIVDLTSAARKALSDRQNAAAKLPLDSEAALRIYRESSQDTVEAFRRRASKNRRVHNAFQTVIIVGSIAVSTLSALNNQITVLSITATVLSAVVGASAGMTGYFKFRERGFNLQSTADEIDKQYTAVQFRFDEYANIEPGQDDRNAEKARLRRFAALVEKIKEEQRKRELQLEQSPERREGS